MLPGCMIALGSLPCYPRPCSPRPDPYVPLLFPLVVKYSLVVVVSRTDQTWLGIMPCLYFSDCTSLWPSWKASLDRTNSPSLVMLASEAPDGP